MPTLGSVGPQREEAENRIKALAAALAARYGVEDPIASLPMRGTRTDNIRLDLASAALVDRNLMVGMLELFTACLEKVPPRR